MKCVELLHGEWIVDCGLAALAVGCFRLSVLSLSSRRRQSPRYTASAQPGVVVSERLLTCVSVACSTALIACTFPWLGARPGPNCTRCAPTVTGVAWVDIPGLADNFHRRIRRGNAFGRIWLSVCARVCAVRAELLNASTYKLRFVRKCIFKTSRSKSSFKVMGSVSRSYRSNLIRGWSAYDWKTILFVLVHCCCACHLHRRCFDINYLSDRQDGLTMLSIVCDR